MLQAQETSNRIFYHFQYKLKYRAAFDCQIYGDVNRYCVLLSQARYANLPKLYIRQMCTRNQSENMSPS
jgi:hypothetical protein